MITLLLVLACGQPTHLQYDFGRAYSEALNTQATLDRESVKNDAYPISGEEALAARANALKAASDEEEGAPTVTATVESGK